MNTLIAFFYFIPNQSTQPDFLTICRTFPVLFAQPMGGPDRFGCRGPKKELDFYFIWILYVQSI